MCFWLGILLVIAGLALLYARPESVLLQNIGAGCFMGSVGILVNFILWDYHYMGLEAWYERLFFAFGLIILGSGYAAVAISAFFITMPPEFLISMAVTAMALHNGVVHEVLHLQALQALKRQ